MGININSTTKPLNLQPLENLFRAHAKGIITDDGRVKISKDGQKFIVSAGRTFKLIGMKERKRLNQFLAKVGLDPVPLFSQRPTVRQFRLAVPTQIGEIPFSAQGNEEGFASALINQIGQAKSQGIATKNSRIGLTKNRQIILYNKPAKVPADQAKHLHQSILTLHLHQLISTLSTKAPLPKAQALTQVSTLLSYLQEIAPRPHEQGNQSIPKGNNNAWDPVYAQLEQTAIYTMVNKTAKNSTPPKLTLKPGPEVRPEVVPKPTQLQQQAKSEPNRIKALQLKMGLK